VRGFHFDGWQRIGIVLSVVWAIAAALNEMVSEGRHYDDAVHAADEAVMSAFDRCEDERSKNGAPNDCIEVVLVPAALAVPFPSRWGIAVAAFAPLPFFAPRSLLLLRHLFASCRAVSATQSPSCPSSDS
jgi:hypothetical protein